MCILTEPSNLILGVVHNQLLTKRNIIFSWIAAVRPWIFPSHSSLENSFSCRKVISLTWIILYKASWGIFKQRNQVFLCFTWEIRVGAPAIKDCLSQYPCLPSHIKILTNPVYFLNFCVVYVLWIVLEGKPGHLPFGNVIVAREHIAFTTGIRVSIVAKDVGNNPLVG